MSDTATPQSPGEAATATGVYYDGATNRRHAVVLKFGPALELVEEGAVIATWKYHDLRRKDAPAQLLRLGSVAAAPLARLEISDETTQRVVYNHAQALNAARRRVFDTAHIVLWSLAAIVSIVLLSRYGVPLVADRLAPLVPVAFEKRFGEAADNQVRMLFGDHECGNGIGRAAFSKLVDEVRVAGGIDVPLDTEVLDSAIPNAFALPGGKVYLLNGLLLRAENADEIAGVIAHELGHVRNRDHMRRLIETGGTSFLVGLLFGDVTGSGAMIFATRTLFDASYSRESETAADGFAVEVMHRLGRSPKPMGELLFRITGAQAAKGLSILAGHPLTEDRLARMTQADRPATGPEILTPAEWLALKGICRPVAPHAAVPEVTPRG